MSATLSIGLVGAGRIASTWVAAVEALAAREQDDSARPKLIGIADPRAEAAQSLAEAANCPAFSDLDALLDGARPEILIVSAPPAAHPSLAVRALEAGVPTLIEKPLAIDRAGALAIREAARRQGTPFSMASKFRFVDGLVRARGLVGTGALGRVAMQHIVFSGRVDMRDRWNSHAEISGGGVLSDNGTHAADIFRFLHGPIVEVMAAEGPRLQGLAVEDSVRVQVRNAEGTLGLFDLSWSLPGGRDNYVEIQGDAGCAEIGWRRSRWRRRADEEWTELGSGYDKIAAFSAQLADFRDALATPRAPLVGEADALASVFVIEAAYRSLASKNWESVEDEA